MADEESSPPSVDSLSRKTAAVKITLQQEKFRSRVGKALETGNLTIIVGAGVSISAIATSHRGNDASRARATESMSWYGLLRHGLAYIYEEQIPLTDAERIELQECLQTLHSQLEKAPTNEEVLRAASFLKRKLTESRQIDNWFDLEFGSIYDENIKQDPNPILDALRALYQGGARIITTNYDDLVDKHIREKPILADGTPALKLFFRKRMNGVCHVHGVWWHTKGTILDNMDYDRITQDETVQQGLKNSITSSEVLLFVGTGAGLEDPNFGTLLAWAALSNEGLAQSHCLLARNFEKVDTIADGLNVLRYGETYSDLPVFLMDLVKKHKPSSSAARLYLVPTTHVAKFIGRKEILEIIEDCVMHPKDKGRPNVVIVQAMGGQGKSQLALEYCRLSKPRSSCFWINATSESTVERDMGIIATLLNRAHDRDLSNVYSKAEFVIEILENWEDRWMLVFDNYDQPSDSHDIRKFWPSRGHGSILVTTRDRATEVLGKMISLPPMTDEEGIELLRGDSDDIRGGLKRHEALKIVTRLGHLPLAVAQASAYLKHEKISAHEFNIRYEAERKTVMGYTPQAFWDYKKVDGPDEKEKAYSVFTTWEMTFKQIHGAGDSSTGGIADFLTTCSFLEPSKIGDHLFSRLLDGQLPLPPWIQLFSSDDMEDASGDDASSVEEIATDSQLTHDAYTATLRNFGQDMPSLTSSSSTGTINGTPSRTWNPKLYWNEVAGLERLSLLKSVSRESPGSIFIAIHPLIRDWLQLRIQKRSTRSKYLICARDIIHQSIMSTSSTLEQKEELVSHVHTFLFYDEHFHRSKSTLDCVNEHGPADHFVLFYSQQGHSRDARIIAQRVLQERTQRLGADHPSTIMAMGNLARTYADLGEMKEARQLEKEVLRLRKQVSGIEHPDTIVAMGNLAATYSDMGEIKEARQLKEEVLRLRKQVSGIEHPSTILAMGNLAATYSDMGEIKEARQLEEEVLRLRKQVSGIEHPSTILAIGNLARTYADLGEMKEARQLEEEVLRLRKQVSGIEHPDTIVAMGNLAATYSDIGEIKEARQLKEEVLRLRKQVSGIEHPDTILAMGNLAVTYSDMGEMKEARQLQEEVLRLRKQVSGIEHPSTILAMGNLARTYADLGEMKEARQLEEEVLKLRKQVSGIEHPDTIVAMGNLAATYSDMGEIKEARQLKEEVLRLRKQVSGIEHPDTILAMGNLAITYSNIGKMKEARQLEEEVLRLRKQVSRIEHPSTILAMGNLAVTYSDMGEMKEARQLQKEVLRLRKQISRIEHPESIRAMGNLARTYASMGEMKEARQLEEEVLRLRKQVSGIEHPDTILAMGNLAVTYADLGEMKEARQLQEEVLRLRKQVSGIEHPSTILAMGNLAATYSDMGEMKEARQLKEEVLRLRKQVSGIEHPDTIQAMGNLNITCADMSEIMSDRR